VRVAINLLNLSSYVDRLQMLGALSQHLTELVVLTDVVPPGFEAMCAQWPRMRVIALGGKRFGRAAFRWLEEARGALDVVHDTFGFLAPFFQVYGPRGDRGFRLVNTLYTSNRAWFDRVRKGPIDLDFRYTMQRILSLWKDARVCPWSDRVLVLGPGHAGDLPADVDPARVAWLPSEVDCATFTPPPMDAPRRRDLLFVGNVCRNKGIGVLLESMAALRETWPDLRLELVGMVLFRETDWLREATARAGVGDMVTVSGRVARDTLLHRYRSAALFVFPSRFEGSPRSVREALACGCRVVASDIPGHRGIDPEARFMRYLSSFEVADWVAAIDEQLRAPPEAVAQRAQAGIQWMRAHHTPAHVAARLAAVYAEVCAEPIRRDMG
jgi:glycosyltransferase involved in cell wall biosynthesis